MLNVANTNYLVMVFDEEVEAAVEQRGSGETASLVGKLEG